MWYKQAHKTIYTNILTKINIKYRKTAAQLHIEKMYRWIELKNSQVNANYYRSQSLYLYRAIIRSDQPF